MHWWFLGLPIFETRFVLHTGVPMKNAAILDCIRSGQPSGCRKLSFWSKLIFPAPKFPHLVDKLFARRLLYFNKRRQPLKSRCPSKSWIFISDDDVKRSNPVFFTRGPAERKVWTKSRMPQRREDFGAYRPCLHLVSNRFTKLHLYKVSEMSWYITIGGRRESKSKQGKRNCDIRSNVTTSTPSDIHGVSSYFMPFQSIS